MSKLDAVAPVGGNALPAAKLLTSPVKVVNIGLKGFADELTAQGIAVQHVDWQPPASGDPMLAALLFIGGLGGAAFTVELG